MIIDAVQLEVFQHLLSSVAEEMGLRLQHSAFSPNIKERRDYSCAIFDDRGEMLALALHIPVHLGSTPLAVQAMIRELGALGEGDTAIANDPYLGGTHLPDVTALTPVVVDGKPRFYVANRAHHADVGGLNSGSMGLTTEIYHEGLRIPPVRYVVGGEVNQDVRRLLMANMRVTAEREGDFAAQVAANHVGVRRMHEIIARYGYRPLAAAAKELELYAERCVREAIRRIPNGSYRFEDQLDDDGTSDRPIPIVVEVRVRDDELEIDFEGTSPQVPGPLNANEAITLSAVFYVLKALIGFRIPDNAGCLRPIHLKIPEGSLLKPRMPAAVAGGNVETSQRIVDVLLGALGQAVRVPAASSGTMTNLTLGGADPRTGDAFTYYETVGGGMGASAESRGLDAVQCHMTNTRNTPIEILESTYPVRVTEYAVRRGSGGRGDHDGGDGLVRELEILAPVGASILADRHRRGPYGMGGAEAGRPGKAVRIGADGKTETLPSKANLKLEAGDRLRIETPGGGGWTAKGAPKTTIVIEPGDIPAIEAREVRRERARPAGEPTEETEAEAAPAAPAAAAAPAEAAKEVPAAGDDRSRRGRRRRKRPGAKTAEGESEGAAEKAAPAARQPREATRESKEAVEVEEAGEGAGAERAEGGGESSSRRRRGRRSQRRRSADAVGPIDADPVPLDQPGALDDAASVEVEVAPGPVPSVEEDLAEEGAAKRRRRGRRGGRRRRRKDGQEEGAGDDAAGTEEAEAEDSPSSEVAPEETVAAQADDEIEAADEDDEDDEDGSDEGPDDDGGGTPPAGEGSAGEDTESGAEETEKASAPETSPPAASRAGAALRSTREAFRRIAGLLKPDERAKSGAAAAEGEAAEGTETPSAPSGKRPPGLLA